MHVRFSMHISHRIVRERCRIRVDWTSMMHCARVQNHVRSCVTKRAFFSSWLSRSHYHAWCHRELFSTRCCVVQQSFSCASCCAIRSLNDCRLHVHSIACSPLSWHVSLSSNEYARNCAYSLMHDRILTMSKKRMHFRVCVRYVVIISNRIIMSTRECMFLRDHVNYLSCEM